MHVFALPSSFKKTNVFVLVNTHLEKHHKNNMHQFACATLVGEGGVCRLILGDPRGHWKGGGCFLKKP